MNVASDGVGNLARFEIEKADFGGGGVQGGVLVAAVHLEARRLYTGKCSQSVVWDDD